MLTKECAVCPWWRNSETESGCARPTPIDDCEAFVKAFEEYQKEKEKNNAYM